MMLIRLIIAAVIGVSVVRADSPAPGPATGLKSERFDKDPLWEGFQNRLEIKTLKAVRQDFGYRQSNVAGREKGEIGGTVFRDSTPASYADLIGPRTLHDRLSASGTFAIKAGDGASCGFCGFFNSGQSEAGRQNSLGMRFSGQGEGARLTLQLVTATNQACGTKITPWVVDKTKTKAQGRKFRPPSIKNDGTKY